MLEQGTSHKVVANGVGVLVHTARATQPEQDEAVPGEAAPSQRMKFYTTQKLGEKQSLTNEGFLLCEDVAIARTGVQVYGDKEVPVEVGQDGIVRIERTADEVFRDETLASFVGKPVTNDHPPVEVTPENWKQYAVGVVQNVRRGEGVFDDLVFADLLITDKDAIAAVRDGKREVSCGYDADYEQLEQGRGLQRNIIGNHVALVEEGRAGSRCSIQDRSLRMKKSLRDRVLDAFKSRDEKALDEAMQGMEDPNTNVHIHLNGAAAASPAKDEEVIPPMEKKPMAEELAKDEDGVSMKLDAILSLLQELLGAESKEAEAKDEDYEDPKEDEEKKTNDAALKDFKVRAELIVPGYSIPTRDSKKVKVGDHILTHKRKVLEQAYRTADGQKIINSFLSGKTADFSKMNALTVDVIFAGASELVKYSNNAQGARSVVLTKDSTIAQQTSVEAINKRNADFWANRR